MKLKPGLGTFYAIQLQNGSGLFYCSWKGTGHLCSETDWQVNTESVPHNNSHVHNTSNREMSECAGFNVPLDT